jgi:tetratricopeptide (TPR) repeat protein
MVRDSSVGSNSSGSDPSQAAMAARFAVVPATFSSSGSGALTVAAAPGAAAASTAAAIAVPLPVVKEALAVVLTDLGTRAKNIGACVCACAWLLLPLLSSLGLAPTLRALPFLLAAPGRLSECEVLYRQALALCPTYPSAHYNLGVLASEGRRWSEALKHYQDTLALAPHHAQVRRWRTNIGAAVQLLLCPDVVRYVYMLHCV